MMFHIAMIALVPSRGFMLFRGPLARPSLEVSLPWDFRLIGLFLPFGGASSGGPRTVTPHW